MEEHPAISEALNILARGVAQNLGLDDPSIVREVLKHGRYQTDGLIVELSDGSILSKIDGVHKQLLNAENAVRLYRQHHNVPLRECLDNIEYFKDKIFEMLRIPRPGSIVDDDVHRSFCQKLAEKIKISYEVKGAL